MFKKEISEFNTAEINVHKNTGENLTKQEQPSKSGRRKGKGVRGQRNRNGSRRGRKSGSR